MKRLESPRTVVAGIALILITNGWILASVARNRATGPQTELLLTERELALPTGREDDASSLALALTLGDRPPWPVRQASWAKGVELPPAEHAWLSRDRLRALGFRVAVEPGDAEAEAYYAREATARVFLVLEYDGKTWRRFLADQEAKLSTLREGVATGSTSKAELEQAEALLALDRANRSRLMPIDAGRDPDALAAAYPDRQRYAVVPGTIEVALDHRPDATPILRTSLALDVMSIHVPRRFHSVLKEFLPRLTNQEQYEARRRDPAWPTPYAPRYRARLAYGRLHQPWLVEVEATGAQE